MDIMTKVRVLWEKVAGITADVSAVDAKATATAATLAGILPRIPADFSLSEVNTGLKYNNKDIFRKSYVIEPDLESTTPVIKSFSTGVDIEDILLFDGVSKRIVEDSLAFISPIVSYSNANNYSSVYYQVSNNKLYHSLALTTNQKYGGAIITIYYTKPDPVPAQADNETRKRKTTKKEDK